MVQTAINKPIYDALVDAGASEEKATLAARAVLPSADEAATKTDIAELKVDLLRWIAVMLGVVVAAIGLLLICHDAQRSGKHQSLSLRWCRYYPAFSGNQRAISIVTDRHRA